MFSRFPRFAFVVAIAAAASLCFSGPTLRAEDKEEAKATHESLGKEFVAIINDAAKAIDAIEDEDTAKAAADTFGKLTKRIEKVSKAVKELDEPTEDDEKALSKLEAAVKKATDKFGEAANGLADTLKEAEASAKTQLAVGESLQKFGTAMLKYSEVVKEVYGEEEEEKAEAK